MMKTSLFATALGLAIGFGVLNGCGGAHSDTDKRIAEAQKQLEEAKKEQELKALEKQIADAKGQTSLPTSASPLAPPSPVIAPTQKKTSPANADQKALRDDIAANKAETERNRQGVEEAKKMATPPPSHTLDAGTPITVRTTNMLSTKTLSTGSSFEATLEEALVDGGYTIAPRGATVEGAIVNADPGGRVKGVASMSLGLKRIIMADGRSLPIQTSSYAVQANKSGKKDAMKVGIASGIGAAIGAIAGGGKGAAIGAGAGAGAGTGVVLGTRGEAAQIPAETVLTFKLSAPVSVKQSR